MKVINTCNDMICGKNKLLNRAESNIKQSKNDEIYGLLAISKEQEKDYYNQIGGNNINKYKLLYHNNKIKYLELILEQIIQYRIEGIRNEAILLYTYYKK